MRVVTLVPGVRMNKAWYVFESVGLSVVCNTAQNKWLGLLASPGINSSTFPLLADLLKEPAAQRTQNFPLLTETKT